MFDVFTGLAAEVKGIAQVGLESEVAEDLADALNFLESRKKLDG